MYSQANVSAGTCVAAPYPSVASVIVDTEKVSREADGSVELVVVRPHADGKVLVPGCASKPSRSWREARRSQAVRIRRKQTSSLPSHESIVQRSAQKQRLWKIVDTLLCRFGYD